MLEIHSNKKCIGTGNMAMLGFNQIILPQHMYRTTHTLYLVLTGE